MPDVLESHEAAALAGCSEELIEDMARRHAVSAIKWGRSWRFPRVAFLESLNDAARKNLETPALPEQVRKPGRPRNP